MIRQGLPEVAIRKGIMEMEGESHPEVVMSLEEARCVILVPLPIVTTPTLPLSICANCLVVVGTTRIRQGSKCIIND